jgi:hypothetical protein
VLAPGHNRVIVDQLTHTERPFEPFRVLKCIWKNSVASMRCEKTDAANRGAFVCLVLELACT